MALAYQKQVRELFFAKKLVETDPKDVGDLNVSVHEEKSLHKGYMIKVKEFTGKTIPSDLIKDNQLISVVMTEPVKKVGAKIKYEFEGTPADLIGETVTFELKLNRRTHEDIYMILTAARPIRKGDTAKIIMDDIAGQFLFQLGNDVRTANPSVPQVAYEGKNYNDNLYFKIVKEGTKGFTIEEKDWVADAFSLHIPEQEIMWRLSGRLFSNSFDDANIKETVVTAPTKAVNMGYQMALFENFLMRGRAEFDTFNPGYGLHRNSIFTDLNKLYYTVDVHHYLISRDDPKHSDKILTIVFEDKVVAEAFVAKFKPAAVVPGVGG